MKKSTLILFLSISVLCFSEEEKKNEKIISIDEERKSVLLYGIDSEVIELVTKLKKEKIRGFDTELLTILENSYDESLKELIFEYFIEWEIDLGENEAFKIFDAIEYEDEYKDSYAKACINYLSEIGSKKAINKLDDVLETENSVIVVSILRLIANNSVNSQEKRLLSMLEDEDLDDQIYLEVIKTLGSIQSIKALDLLIPILEDVDEETSVRNAVSYSLGEIGDKKAIEPLKEVLKDRTNFLLRKNALDALSKFNSKEIEDILIASLRDNHWQIRSTAIKGIKERKVIKAFPNLKHKALYDPEAKIKKEAFQVIGDLNTIEGREFLREVYIEDSYKESQKIIVIEKLIEHNIDFIFSDIEELYKEKNSEKRKPVLDNTLKFLSESENNLSSTLFGKMLKHENYVYKIYAIKGIRTNSYTEHIELLKTMSEEDKNRSVKKHALAAWEELISK